VGDRRGGRATLAVQVDLYSGGVQPAVQVAPKTVLRVAGAIVLLSMSMHYLATGRKEASLQRMITGAILALASLLFL
jgi:hypothetical protein